MATELIDIGPFAAYGVDAPFFEEVRGERLRDEERVARVAVECATVAAHLFCDQVLGERKPASGIMVFTSEELLGEFVDRETEGEDTTGLRQLIRVLEGEK